MPFFWRVNDISLHLCILFIHSSIDRHMDDFHFLAIVNNAITMSVHISDPHLHFFCVYAHKWTCWIGTLIFWGLWKSSKLRKRKSNAFICDILIQDSIGYLMPLEIPFEFYNEFFNVQKYHWDIDRDCTESVNHFWW